MSPLISENTFWNGKATINEGMRKILEKTIPAYSATLFEDPKVADKITNVEIIGYASPTYQGNLSILPLWIPKTEKAVQYNLELSQKRANAIFEHIFDKKKMTFNHQKELLPLVKVTGQNFLPEKKRAAGIGKSNDFCETMTVRKHNAWSLNLRWITKEYWYVWCKFLPLSDNEGVPNGHQLDDSHHGDHVYIWIYSAFVGFLHTVKRHEWFAREFEKQSIATWKKEIPGQRQNVSFYTLTKKNFGTYLLRSFRKSRQIESPSHCR